MTGSFRGPTVSRRRTLTLLAAAPGLALPWAGPWGRARAGETAALHRWQGVALGARASLLLHHRDAAAARRMVARALAEMERLERVFSLYRADSALVALNSEGRLANPPLDLVDLLARARLWHKLSDGAFDVTVQPLWECYRRHFEVAGAAPGGPPPEALARARALVDGADVQAGPREVRLARPGMALTLNGIAQGYIADRVADLLRAEGLEQVLIDLGEMVVLGLHPEGRPWRVALAHGRSEAGALDLTDRALATSAPGALTFDAGGRYHHLFDPARGAPAKSVASASVVARRACDADALSTALAVGYDMPSIPPHMSALGIELAVISAPDGRVRRLT